MIWYCTTAGVNSPRLTATDGSPLPHPREVSTVVHRSDYREEPTVSMLFVMWGQFIDHDMEASGFTPGGKPHICQKK